MKKFNGAKTENNKNKLKMDWKKMSAQLKKNICEVAAG